MSSTVFNSYSFKCFALKILIKSWKCMKQSAALIRHTFHLLFEHKNDLKQQNVPPEGQQVPICVVNTISDWFLGRLRSLKMLLKRRITQLKIKIKA